MKKAEEAIVKRVERKLDGKEGKEKKILEKLPMAANLFKDHKTMLKAVEQLRTAHELKDEADRMNERYQGVKQEIVSVCMGAEVPGFRHGELAVTVNIQARKALNKETLRGLLVDEGVDPEVVSRCMERATEAGEEFYTMRLEKL